ncbi:retrotransposon protein [Cucumis melo var. makuwa]|uniref:Retrotransposon protein n=1 Tax=Cucumis melo var. makuwa TaxID=1194695 RepID=A0A5A7T2Z5_CUCMM|nr:retrotransposon protein [Cucumis melo var. makuwa]TYK27221.1 retrotransposon protein [Cucumis melo var. makuwa]
MLGKRMTDCSLMTTVIESRIKLLKKTFLAIVELRGPTDSDFSWNDDVKCIIAKRDVFNHWVRGARAETFADISLNVPTDNDSIPAEDGMGTEFPTMCSPRMNMLPEDMMGDRSGRSTPQRMAWARSSLLFENHYRMPEESYQPEGRDGDTGDLAYGGHPEPYYGGEEVVLGGES